MGLKIWARRFLSRFYEAFRGQLAEPHHGSSREHELYRLLSRYIFQSGHFNSQRVKQGAFLPKPSELKISAAWIDNLTSPEIWAVGDILASQSRPPRIPLARADFDAAVLSDVRLTTQDDKAPHPRHVNICGWPLEKDAQKAVALFLCSKATLTIR
jgi:hypothetical protein